MQYLLLIYGNEAGMQSASKADMEQMMAAYGAYTQAMKTAGVMVAADRLKPSDRGEHGADRRRQDQGARRALCRDQGAARRLLPDRRARSRRRIVVGGALPRRQSRRHRSAPDLDDVGAQGRLRDGERGHARDRGGGGAPQLRQAGRLSRGAHRRCRGRRGCAVGSLRRRAHRLGCRRHSRQSRRLAADGGAPPRGRCGAAAAQRRGRDPPSPAHGRGTGGHREAIH